MRTGGDGAPRRRAGGARRRAGGRASPRPSAASAVPVTAARPARAARQRDDPGEGAHARAAAFRGLGVLRQAHARAARSLHAAPEPGDAHLRAGAERHLARRATGRCSRTSRPGRSWCCWSAGLPAFIAEAKFSGDAFRLFRWRSPETRMQIYLETVLAREDHAKEVKLFGLGPRLLERYRRHLSASVRGRPRAHHPARCLGFRARSHRHRRALRRLRLDRGQHGAPADHPRADDDVRRAVSPGTGRGVGHSYRDRRHVRGQSLPVDAVRVPGDRGAGSRAAALTAGPHPEDGIRFEDGEFHLSGGASEPALEHVTLHLVPGREPRAGGRERLGQDHAHQAPDPPLRAHRGPHPARRS